MILNFVISDKETILGCVMIGIGIFILIMKNKSESYENSKESPAI